MRFVALGMLLLTVWATGAAAADRRPNILVIFTDDLDFDEIAALRPYSDTALAGGKPKRPLKPLTPHLDRLVGESRTFTQFHVAAVVCTPSRYALLTGQYCSRSASLQAKHPTSGPANVEFNTHVLPGQWHLARGLKAAGYVTGIVGKWHLTELKGSGTVVDPPICNFQGKEFGPQDPLLPENDRRVRAAYAEAVRHLREDIGWDYAAGIYMANANQLGLPRSMWQHESNMEWFTDGALRFLDSQTAEQPFFLYFAPNIPHGGGGKKFAAADPHGTPEGWIDRHAGVQPSRDDVLRRIRDAGAEEGLAWATWLDDGIGAILKRLDERGLAENTIVLFSSDQQSHGKWTCYEGARVPLCIRRPGKIAPGTRDDALLSSVDFAPTVLELAGAQLPAPNEAVVDGRSFAALLDGGRGEARPVLIEMGYGRAVVADGWKYIAVRHPAAVEAEAQRLGRRPDFLGRFREKSENRATEWPAFYETDQLYDLRSDPLEQRNLAGDVAHAERLATMRTLLKRCLAPLPHAFGEFTAARR